MYLRNIIQSPLLQLLNFEQINGKGTFLLGFCLICGFYYLLIWMMNPKLKARFKRLLKMLVILFSIFFFFDMTTSIITIFQINWQLGFSYSTPETKDGEIFRIQRVSKGKVMDKAGLKPWDRVLMHNVDDLYRLLIQNQGKEIIIPIIRENEKIEIKLIVPELNAPLKKVSFVII